MNFVIGAAGRLGSALVNSLPAEQVIVLQRADYADWWREGAADKIAFFLEKLMGRQENAVMYVTAGILDPSQPYEQHHNINFLLPKYVIEGASKVGIRTVTFGTVMEKVIGAETNNSYVQSKLKLGRLVEECSHFDYPPLHIRVHTLYGIGLPSPFMFIGQILNSLVNKIPFKMSPGNQLREYHHIEDEINAINALITAKLSGSIELSSGNPVSLRDIAHYIFNYFNCLDLLNIGAVSAPEKDNYNLRFERPPQLSHIAFRETLPNLVDYLYLCREQQQRESLCLD